MPARVRTALSMGVHTLVGLIVSVLVAHGITIPAGWSTYGESALLGLVVALYAALTHWLASRVGQSGEARVARMAAKVLTLGTGALIPAPPPVPASVALLRDQSAKRAAAAGKHTAAP